MSLRTAVITGANAGLGLECARALVAANDEWHVVLAVRDVERGNDAAKAIARPERCSVMRVDLGSLESVRDFALALRDADVPPLHAIVCNAGVQVVSRTQKTADGVEKTFGVNHLGHFALVDRLLLDLSNPARIIVVSSATHDPAHFTGMPAPRYTRAADLATPTEQESSADGRRRYTTSKLCNVLFAYELDRRLGHGQQGITVNAFDPGLMPSTGLSRDYPLLGRWAFRYVFSAMRFLPFVNSTRTSGRRLAALVHESQFSDTTGTYFSGGEQAASSQDSYDAGLAEDLWQTSEQLVSLVE